MSHLPRSLFACINAFVPPGLPFDYGRGFIEAMTSSEMARGSSQAGETAGEGGGRESPRSSGSEGDWTLVAAGSDEAVAGGEAEAGGAKAEAASQ
jgi:hypothetical protein